MLINHEFDFHTSSFVFKMLFVSFQLLVLCVFLFGKLLYDLVCFGSRLRLAAGEGLYKLLLALGLFNRELLSSLTIGANTVELPCRDGDGLGEVVGERETNPSVCLFSGDRGGGVDGLRNLNFALVGVPMVDVCFLSSPQETLEVFFSGGIGSLSVALFSSFKRRSVSGLSSIRSSMEHTLRLSVVMDETVFPGYIEVTRLPVRESC